jgi:hypothetical protein
VVVEQIEGASEVAVEAERADELQLRGHPPLRVDR